MLCRYCDTPLAPGATRQQDHLNKCVEYHDSIQQEKKRKLNSLEFSSTAFDRISPAKHSRLDRLTALMIYDTGLPFVFFEHSSVQAFLRNLRPGYTTPISTRLYGGMLEKAYNTVKKKVDKHLNSQDHLNITFDKTSNVVSQRVINIAVTTDRGAFYDQTITLNTITVNSEYAADTV
jgi:hypothetical protein